MFMLYAIPIGLFLGWTEGGSFAGLSRLTFRWAWFYAAGLLIQLALFSEPIAARVGELGSPIYVASTTFVAIAVVVNWRIPGMPLVAAGAICNLVAIVSNGGYMPAAPQAMAALGKVDPSVYSNSDIRVDPAFGVLTDIFAMPDWMPWSNVFSIGDLLIGLGVVVVMVVAMRSSAPADEASERISNPAAPALVGGASAH